MNTISKKIATLIVKAMSVFAKYSVNTTCVHKYYQEELDENVNELRKY